MSGAGGWSQTTQWTQIVSARTLHAERRKQRMGAISARYWKPVYLYLRGRGLHHDDAEELTQGFFTDVVIDRELIQHADRARGSFRAFLRTALTRYVTNRNRDRFARKRMPQGGLTSLDGMEAWQLPQDHDIGKPDDAFVYAWASALLDDVLAVVKAGCLDAGQEKHWSVFHKTVVESTLGGAEVPPLSQICLELGIETESKASNMNITVKRRFKAALRVRIRQFVDRDDQVDEEIHDLMRILSSSGAGSP